MRSRSRKSGFFSDWKRVAIVAALGGVVLAAAIILLLRLNAPKEPEEVPPNPVATITMSNGGQMRFTLYPDLAPNTVANFIRLANRGFYDGQQFSHMRGAISMARPSGYDTAGSQFFIMQGSYPEYDGRYAAFGSIDDGDDKSLAVLDAIASQPTDSTYLPLTRQVIGTIRVETFDADYGDPVTLERE